MDNKSVNWRSQAAELVKDIGVDKEVTCSTSTRTLKADDKCVGVARRRHRLKEKRNSLCFASSYASDD
ncbi:hypothetical protein ACEYW6_29595 [Nostoc sp. UIC 10607]|uniref:hypothetical protein n=1 Tax=Nostoc sp. UIC 10607 TaxID=3045935 RepID=UPI0039A0B42D